MNTNFFHFIANSWRSQNAISRIIHDGKTFCTPDEVKSAAVSAFSKPVSHRVYTGAMGFKVTQEQFSSWRKLLLLCGIVAPRKHKVQMGLLRASTKSPAICLELRFII